MRRFGPELPGLVGSRLRELRLAKGLAAREVSLSLGKPPHFVSSVEAGDEALTLEDFLALAQALDCDPVLEMEAIVQGCG